MSDGRKWRGWAVLDYEGQLISVSNHEMNEDNRRRIADLQWRYIPVRIIEEIPRDR